jgi:Dna[CI] antecedent, DciA
MGARGDDRARGGLAGGDGGLERLGDLLGARGSGPDHGPVADWPLERRLIEVWAAVVGADVAGNATPVSLRRGRLTVATSSSVWAQTLQLMGESMVERLNGALGEAVVTAVICRPAGWDPGGGTEGPKALRGEWSDGSEEAQHHQGATVGRGLPDLPLSAEEEAAIADVERADLDPELRARMVRVMRGFFLRAHEREAAQGPGNRRR